MFESIVAAMFGYHYCNLRNGRYGSYELPSGECIYHNEGFLYNKTVIKNGDRINVYRSIRPFK